jgi:hypothetical protein
MKIPATIVALAACLITFSMTPRATEDDSPIPFKKGIVWVYEGTFFNTDEHRVYKITAEWEMRVVDIQQVEDMQVAVVENLPGRYNPEYQEPHSFIDLVVRDAQGQYFIAPRGALSIDPIPGKPDANRLRAELSYTSIFWVPNPTVGLLFGQEPGYSRTDGWYCWRVMGWRKFDVSTVIKGSPQRYLRRYVIGFYTGPDHQITDFVEGVGIVRSVYVHHGTIIESYIRLKEVRVEKGS